jgi:transcription elongation factor Elf1
MKCLECGKKMVLTALQSDTGHRGEYYPQLSIPIPANLHKATTELRKRLIEVFYGGNEYRYTGSDYKDTPQHKQDMDKVWDLCFTRPKVSIYICNFCGSGDKIQTNLGEILRAVELCNKWIDEEEISTKAKKESVREKIKKDKKENYQKKIAALQKKLKKLEE